MLSCSEYQRLLENNIPILPDTCVEIDGYVLPVLKKYDSDKIGISGDKHVTVFNPPQSEEDKQEYAASKIIDFSKMKDMRENIAAMDELKGSELSRLSTINNVLILPIQEENSVELKAIKTAINMKKIDADSYKAKFPSDSDFNNDMRALKSPDNNNISFFKLKRILDAFDMNATLSIRDKKDAVNPIGEEISVDLATEDTKEE